ncbi:hypothetical protein [Mycolicibacterium tusciae]|uniref:hypothetical protein n=1 Tax=Mycolicibacterium tusciae TaxID=75922 RepID=UPI00024A1E96|nr:hypothetical protein [Mycolicibacterium tusciae]
MEDVFIGSEALAVGVLTRGQLRSKFRAFFPDVYMLSGALPSLSQRAVGAWLWSGRRAVVAGLAASALHGARWVDESADVEVIWRNTHPPRGIVARSERIESDEIMDIAGILVTTPERTAWDLARHHPRDLAVASLDALSSATGITASGVQPLVDRYRRSRHWWRAVDAIRLMDGGSQSPQETMVRLALVDAGLPAPKTQFAVTDGVATAVIAMAYEAPMVGVEFGSITPDVVVRKGWTMIRANDPVNPKVVVYLVRAAVIERGYPLWKLRRVSRG